MKFLLGILVAAAMVLPVVAGSLEWTPTFDEAMKEAKESKRPVLVFFTGSDWCPACKMFDKEILSKKDVENYAKDNFVLYKADFPQNHKPAAAIARTNNSLMRKYRVEGFPTIVILDADGKELGRTGFMRGVESQGFIKNLKKIVK